MILLGTRNLTAQTVLPGGIVNLGTIYRQDSCKTDFVFNGDSVSLKKQGIYNIRVTITLTAPTAGDVTFQIFRNGVAIPGAFDTTTITTATTEFDNIVIDDFELVDQVCILGSNQVENASFTLVNNGATSANISKVIVHFLGEKFQRKVR